ncbi:MAG: radical SAM protein [Nanoarchaeota archaeon]
MHYTIIDCYTDEPSGLGVPPYLGTYPRYIYGKLKKEGKEVAYLTIDDLRLWKRYGGIKKEPSEKEKTNISIYNTTKNNAKETINKTDKLIVILGVHVPGKYLTARPGTLREITLLLRDIKAKKILAGPAIYGTQLEGGKFFEKIKTDVFDEIAEYNFSFEESDTFISESAEILEQIPGRRIIEIETSRGCKTGKCSFCTEPLKSCFLNRKKESIINEIKLLYKQGARHFRIGKQADFYSSDRPVELLKEIRESCPEIETLHIDNVNANSVITPAGEKITEAIAKYCTSGNVAALGIESFDLAVIKANFLNTSPATALKAMRIINKYGAERGENGLPKFLPGINIIFGLLDESKQTQQRNMEALQQILSEGLLIRRINIRQAAILPGTYIERHGGNKFLRKNKQYYWKWRNKIRQKIDFEMLKRLVPQGTELKEVYTEMYDGKTTFCRQMGTYPLIIGVKERLPLHKKISVKVVGHMLRSIVGEVVES